MKTSTGAPTKAEAERIKRMLALGCIVCMEQFGVVQPAECHHIVRGNRRLGHWYTLPLCCGHHRGYWPDLDAIKAYVVDPPVSIASGTKAFAAAYGSEMYLWALVQYQLDLPGDAPSSKIVPRRQA